MLNQTITLIAFLFISASLSAQDCPILNTNCSFEETIYVPGGEPAIGITTGQIKNWSASHGTADYITSDWNWYDLEGIVSNAGHLCYGNRDAHDHSEGIYTSVNILGDDDLLYTLSVDYSTVCESTNNGFLNIALNNKLNSEGHNWFQYPTPEAFPEFFDEIQAVERMELRPEANFDQNGMSNFEVSFVPEQDFSQIWLFTEYQHDEVDFINCGLILDNVELTATTSALSNLVAIKGEGNSYKFAPEYTKDLEVLNYTWIVDQDEVSNEDVLTHEFEEGEYTICLNITDSRGACGTACYELIIDDSAEVGTSQAITSVPDTEADSTDETDDEDPSQVEGVLTTINLDSDTTNDNVETNKSRNIDFFTPVVVGATLEVRPLNATVEFSDMQGAIFNTAGQLIMNLENVDDFGNINLDHLPVGVYVLKLINKNMRQSKTFFKGDEVI